MMKSEKATETKAAKPETPPTFARHHPAVCLAKGLFVAKQSGPRVDEMELLSPDPVVKAKAINAAKKQKALLATQRVGDTDFVFRGHAQLGSDDLRVLQGLFAMASAPDSKSVMDAVAPKTNTGTRLSTLLKLTGPHMLSACPSKSRIVTTSQYGLAQEIGLSPESGGNRKNIMCSLRRLSGVSVVCFREGVELGGANLLAYINKDDEAGKLLKAGQRDTLVVAINPALSSTILFGQTDVRHVRIDMSEVRALRRDSARLIHQRLCAFVDPGSTRQVSAMTLAEYAFGDDASDSTKRKRLAIVKRDMEELAGLGWVVSNNGARGEARIFSVSRPKRQELLPRLK